MRMTLPCDYCARISSGNRDRSAFRLPPQPLFNGDCRSEWKAFDDQTVLKSENPFVKKGNIEEHTVGKPGFLEHLLYQSVLFLQEAKRASIAKPFRFPVKNQIRYDPSQ
jgi:hypothetical protein